MESYKMCLRVWLLSLIMMFSNFIHVEVCIHTLLLLMSEYYSIGKEPDAGEDWGQEEKGATEDEMVGWHHWLNGHEFEQMLGDGEGQGSLVCYRPWGCKDSDMTEWLNNNYCIVWIYHILFIHLFIDGHLNFSMFWLLWNMLLWTLVYKFLCGLRARAVLKIKWSRT